MTEMFRLLLVLAYLLPSTVVANALATDALNSLRESQGLHVLQYSQKLEKAAKSHAEDMANRGFFSHTGSNGSDVGRRVLGAGYKWCFVAENIARGQQGLEAVVSAWARSPGHRANMLSREAKEFALYEAADRTWVMVLAAPC
jgi:uncharacterized protein YkwD